MQYGVAMPYFLQDLHSKYAVSIFPCSFSHLEYLTGRERGEGGREGMEELGRGRGRQRGSKSLGKCVLIKVTPSKLQTT